MLALTAVHPLQSVSAGSQSTARGAELFAMRGCAHCHGNAGIGGGRGPDLQLVRKKLKPIEMQRQIRDGGKAMPPYGEQLTDSEIHDLIDYLRSKRKAPIVTKANQ